MEAAMSATGAHALRRDGVAVPDESWLDVRDLARRYKTSTRHVYRMADSGRMPWGVKIGQLRRWSRREIEDWEAGGCLPVKTVGRAGE